MSNPKYTSITQIKDEDVRMKRQRGSLLAHNTDTNHDKLPDPSLKWIENGWKGDFKENQKEKLIKELQ